MKQRITWRQLGSLIAQMNEYQKDMDVTAEVFDGQDTECFAGTLRICGNEHDSLEDGHPVIYVDQTDDIGERVTDLDKFSDDIGLTLKDDTGWFNEPS